MERVLITGGAGFIGAFLARALAEKGTDVVLVDNLLRGRRDTFMLDLIARPNVSLVECDLLDDHSLDALGTGFTHIFHFAAILGVQNVLQRPYETIRSNIRLLDSALSFAQRQSGLERFLFPSTSEVYAGSLACMDIPIPTPEDTPLALTSLDEPRTSYMLSKICGEAMVNYSGVPYTIVRPHNFYGPRMGMSHVIPQLLEKAHRAANGSSIEVYSIDHTRTFCFIDDAVEMIVRAVTRATALDAVLNVGSDEPEITIEELAGAVIRTVGKDLTIVPMPATPGSPERRCPDVTRMTRAADYRATTTIEDGLGKTYAWYRPMVFEGGETEVAR